MLLASEQEYKRPMKGPRESSRLERSVVHTSGSMVRARSRACVGPLSNRIHAKRFRARTLAPKPWRSSGTLLTLHRPPCSELNSSPKKEPTQVHHRQSPTPTIPHVLSAPIVAQNRKLYSHFARQNNESLVLLLREENERRLHVMWIFFNIKATLVWPGNRVSDAISRPWTIGPLSRKPQGRKKEGRKHHAFNVFSTFWCDPNVRKKRVSLFLVSTIKVRPCYEKFEMKGLGCKLWFRLQSDGR